jgi:hypothetical protein
VWGVFLFVAVSRCLSVYAIEKFGEVPDLGRWLARTTAEDEQILVVAASLQRFGYAPSHFDYYHGPIYTWPMPHFGYYAERKIRWGIRDLGDLTAVMDGSHIRFAVVSEEYTDSLVDQAREYLVGNGVEIPAERWGGRKSAAVRLFALGDVDATRFR